MIAETLDAEAGMVRTLVETWSDAAAEPRHDHDAQVAAWIALAADERRKVSGRLQAFVALVRSNRRGDLARLSDDLGLSRPNAHRLLRRMEQVGPVLGLITHRRTAGRRSSTRDGFGDPWDDWIEALLAGRPDLAVPTLHGELTRMWRARGGAEGGPPEITALRRRVNRIRPDAGIPSEAEPVGRDLLIDQAGLSAVVDGEDGPMGLGLMVVLDAPSGLLVGHALMHRAPLPTLVACVASVEGTLADLARSGAPIAEAIHHLAFHPVRADQRGDWVGAAVPAGRRPNVSIVDSPTGRHGDMLLRRIGDRLEGFGLSTLRLDARGRPVASPSGSAATYSSMDEAAYAVGLVVSRWNAARLDRMAPVGARGRPASIARAAAIAEDLRLAFLPFERRWDHLSRRMREITERASGAG